MGLLASFELGLRWHHAGRWIALGIAEKNHRQVDCGILENKQSLANQIARTLLSMDVLPVTVTLGGLPCAHKLLKCGPKT